MKNIKSAYFTFIVCLLLFISFAGATNNSVVDLLKDRYATLSDRYTRLQSSGADTSSLNELVEKIKTAKNKKQSKKHLAQLSRLLDDFEVQLERLEIASEFPDKTVSTAHIIKTKADEQGLSEKGVIQLLQGFKTSERYHTLLKYRGHEKLIASNGAVGRNIKKFSDVAAQRGAGWLLLRALHEGNADYVKDVVQAMKYAFRFQSKDGYFNNGRGVSARKAVGVDAFFLQSFARIYLLIKASHFRDQFICELNTLKPNVAQALLWMKEQTDELYRQDKNATNRLLFDGLAFILNGQLIADQEYINIGEGFVRKALQAQREDGTFNEHGGYDSSYQAVSILNLTVVWAYTQNTQLKQVVYHAIEHAAAWQRTRIGQDGEVLVTGNTRTGLGQEKFLGKEKEVNYAEVAMALYYWSQISKQRVYQTLADSVIQYAVNKRGHNVIRKSQ